MVSVLARIRQEPLVAGTALAVVADALIEAPSWRQAAALVVAALIRRYVTPTSP